jgi:hypothetical protein
MIGCEVGCDGSVLVVGVMGGCEGGCDGWMLLVGVMTGGCDG